MDTSDTADTLNSTDTGHYWNDECDHISAAEIAGEEGGFSCQVSTAQPDNWAITFGIILGLIMVIRRKRC